MVFAMKGGGRSRGGLECHIPILKNDFLKNHLESFPDRLLGGIDDNRRLSDGFSM